jgi:hypothetical protein
MLNAGRRIDLAIFTLSEAVCIGKADLKPGLQQIFRNDDIYYFKKVGEKAPYAEVPISENIAVLKIVFSSDMFTGGFSQTG